MSFQRSKKIEKSAKSLAQFLSIPLRLNYYRSKYMLTFQMNRFVTLIEWQVRAKQLSFRWFSIATKSI